MQYSITCSDSDVVQGPLRSSSADTNRAAMKVLLRQSASLVSHSKSALEAASSSPSNSLGSIHSSASFGNTSKHAHLASRLHRQLAALLPRLPPAVANDQRCGGLKAALAQLPPALDASTNACSDALLQAARAAVAMLTNALADFAGDLRTAHIAREEAEEAARQASDLVEDLRSKKDAAVLDGLVRFQSEGCVVPDAYICSDENAHRHADRHADGFRG